MRFRSAIEVSVIFWVPIGILVLASSRYLYRRKIEKHTALLEKHFEWELGRRMRIARDAHDSLLQTIESSKMVTDNALDHRADEACVSETLHSLSQWLGYAIIESRAAMLSLKDSAPNESGS